ncbi:MAG TPA: SIS domain-containing protein, partial [Candidatus Intestinimonas pullistercoris]|nr:SIS domain-containing protein [Candidatus Intestinimonas pullistercoris]
ALVSELLTIPTKMEEILENREAIQYYASIYFNHESIFFIGRNIDYAIGLEGSLKLKEISYIHSEAYAAGELKHGTISLIERGTLVVALASCVPLFDKLVSNVVEVKSRGADVLGLTVASKGEVFQKTVDHVITVPDTHPMLLPSLDVIPMQLFAYYVALMRGCDIDKPRNLAKSVTVE